MELFGFEIKRRADDNVNIPSFVTPEDNDGAVNIAATGTGISTFLDMDGTAKSEAELVQKYRTMLQQPEVSQAVDDIVNEAICVSTDNKVVECITDDLDLADNIKKKVREEFDTVLKLLDFSNNGYETFQKWYVDGRINYHIMIDIKSPKKGIQELRYIDPRKIRKIREYDNAKIGSKDNQVTGKKVKNEYYIYSEKGFNNIAGNQSQQFNNDGTQSGLNGLKIAKDSIVNANSGMLNESSTLVLSHMHKAYKPLNQLRMMEDAVVIYRISRAPERRIFYIDVGNLPKMKAEQYLRDMMTKHKNRLVYDMATGDVKDDRRHMSMTDEIKFSKFISRLRARFSTLFDKLLEKQLILKGVITPDDWPKIAANLRYDFMSDNHFEELKTSEILRERLGILRDIDDYTGKYYSQDWVRKNVLYMSEDDIESMDKEIEDEEEKEPEEDSDNNEFN